MIEKKISKEDVKRLREEGVPAAAIAEMYGISRARVYQLTAPKKTRGYRPITEERNIYPIWRRWMNENSVTPGMLLDMMGLTNTSQTYNVLWGWMRGRCYPTKKNIDRLIGATGLTYEQLFSLEDK